MPIVVGFQIFSVSPIFKKTAKTHFPSTPFYHTMSDFCTSVASVSPKLPTSSISQPMQSKHSLSFLAPLEAILFDIDGTLCDSDPIHYYAFREMLQEVDFNGGEPITEEFFIKNISGMHNDELCHVLFPDWDFNKAMKFMEDKEEMFRSFFELLIIGSECERAKPFPDPYLKALQELGVSPEHAFVFEDSKSGTKAGVAAGMPVLGLATRNPEELLREAGATFVIKDFEDTKLWAALEEL